MAFSSIARSKSGKLYAAGVCAFVAALCLIPPWQGRFYNQDFQSGIWHDGGTFGLKIDFAPIWYPPAAYSDDIDAQVRYPWQVVSAHEHAEIFLIQLAFILEVGVAAIGILARIASAFESPGRPDPIIRFGFALAISQVISLAATFMYALATMFWGDDNKMWIIPLVCGTIGSIVGLWLAKHAQPSLVQE